MRISNDTRGYGIPAKAFHWGVAALVFILLPLGWYMHDLPQGLERYRYVELHKSLGLVVLILMLGRSLWRAFNPPPPLPENLPRWEVYAAKLTHWALYGALFAQVFIGMVLVWAANSPLLFFGWFALPSPIAPDKPLRHLMEEAHEITAFVIVILVIMHIGAALRHHFILQNNILRRMLGLMLMTAAVLVPVRGSRAATWIVLPTSQILFHFTQSSLPYTGKFERFEARVEFDPDRPEDGRINVMIDISSLDTQNEERDAMLRSAELFDAGKFPQAQFTADKIRAAGPGQYEAVGALTIRDITHPLVLPFGLEIQKDAAEGDSASASGSVTISRRDFGLARGQWEAVDIVADEVRIEIKVEATQQR